MKTKLLPCPFCGEKAVPMYKRSDGSYKSVTCGNRFCSLRNFLIVRDWNRRFVCLDKNGDKVFVGDKVGLSCGCCEYTVELRNGFAVPIDDGSSQVHSMHFNVWAHEIELIKEDK